MKFPEKEREDVSNSTAGCPDPFQIKNKGVSGFKADTGDMQSSPEDAIKKAVLIMDLYEAKVHNFIAVLKAEGRNVFHKADIWDSLICLARAWGYESFTFKK